MPRDGEDILGEKLVTPEFELAILRLWAAAIHIERSFSRQEIEAIPALSRTLAESQLLPSAIGWGDVLPGHVVSI